MPSVHLGTPCFSLAAAKKTAEALLEDVVQVVEASSLACCRVCNRIPTLRTPKKGSLTHGSLCSGKKGRRRYAWLKFTPNLLGPLFWWPMSKTTKQFGWRRVSCKERRPPRHVLVATSFFGGWGGDVEAPHQLGCCQAI